MSKTKMSKNEIEQKIRDLKTKLSCQESDIGAVSYTHLTLPTTPYV